MFCGVVELFGNHFADKERADCLFYCCHAAVKSVHVSIPLGTWGWAVVCDCDIF